VSYLFFGAQRRRDLPAVGRRKEIGENLSDLPEAGRLFVNLFFIWRAKAQRRKEKTPLRLCESTSFFSRTKKKSLQ